jgi:hypothetical protein
MQRSQAEHAPMGSACLSFALLLIFHIGEDSAHGLLPRTILHNAMIFTVRLRT